MNFYKTKNIICFSKEELTTLFEKAIKDRIHEEIKNNNLSSDDLKEDSYKMKELADKIGKEISEHRDIHEIFASLFIFLNFYETESEVCFELNSSFDPDFSKIQSLEHLNKFREGIFSDFIIRSQDGFRDFQLKRYRDQLDEQSISDFVSLKVKGYGNNLGDVNLLVILQSKERSISNIEFSLIHKKIKELNLSFKGQILIAYNENNNFSVIIQVYPELRKSSVALNTFSTNKNDVFNFL